MNEGGKSELADKAADGEQADNQCPFGNRGGKQPTKLPGNTEYIARKRGEDFAKNYNGKQPLGKWAKSRNDDSHRNFCTFNLWQVSSKSEIGQPKQDA